MNKKMTLIITNMAALIVYMLIHYGLYSGSFNFWQALVRGLGLLALFNVFNWFFKKKGS